MLTSPASALSAVYDLAMLDLDGVVYIGGSAVPGAAASIARAREDGMRIAFVTNNAARPPGRVAEHLRELEIEAQAQDVVTSAQAAARVLRDRFGAGARIAALGAEGLVEALAAAELEVVDVEADADAAVTGYGPDVRWRDIMRIATRIKGGLPWVASNTDGSIPTPYGEAPGHGVLVDTIARFSGVTPVVAGKPSPPLLQETIRRVGGKRPLMVGDRLDTDIEGGTAVGVDTLLVMTGVTGLDELLAAPSESRPTYLAADLSGLLVPHPEPEVTGAQTRVGGWVATVQGGSARLTGEGSAHDWWRALAHAAWAHLDATGTPVGGAGLEPPSPSAVPGGGSLPA
ncbi:HAD-IIA family hydrolase [Nocardioides sp. BP30]|uniref:HAD-IIA family hydrolase n=1 Tax=Nocardioides sp. BP30 TaxID=3036374 RepID=UPI00246891B5|nr:HAD-IIA family hydrolase [Nocardioides sp. BP30]WGL50514.1 HAD-IIA family hydrolase [Nocardioides sp. BP30]